jgi:hypothetical protein
MSAPSGPTRQVAMPVNSLVSAMVDTTEYGATPARSPSARHGNKTSDEQILQQFAAGITAFPRMAAEGDTQDVLEQSNDFSAPYPALIVTPMRSAEELNATQNDSATASSAEITALSSETLTAARRLSPHTYRELSSSPSTPQPRSRQHPPQTISALKVRNVNSSTSRSLYPGPSATICPWDLDSSDAVRKRPRTARSDHPERFLYSGNTFSNLDNPAFNEAAENNPYLSQLTIDASRPVYRTPLEARQALKAVEEPAMPAVDYDQQIKELLSTIAEFHKKYEKAKHMTTQAGIRVAGNVWDRLSNIVQYPPDFNAYGQKGHVDIEKYVEEMKAWDLAIGHQVIIKKRIIYKEAIEKLQVKLDIVQAEKDLDSRNTQLKRKADEIADGDDDDGDEMFV